tara:strand:- start:3450 stop:3938 length:489 start_codon:yes stop_codon:yes gene_type:complete
MDTQNTMQDALLMLSRHCDGYLVKDKADACNERLYLLESGSGIGYRESLHLQSHRLTGVLSATLITGVPEEIAKGREPVDMLSMTIPGFTHRTLTLQTLGQAGMARTHYYLSAYAQVNVRRGGIAQVEDLIKLVDATFAAYGIPHRGHVAPVISLPEQQKTA